MNIRPPSSHIRGGKTRRACGQKTASVACPCPRGAAGTSTGGIVALALADGKTPAQIAALYRGRAGKIFDDNCHSVLPHPVGPLSSTGSLLS